jgi:hypothetical protein
MTQPDAGAGIMAAMDPLVDIIERLFRPNEGGFSEDLARYVLSIHFTDAQKARYAALADKVDQGAMDIDEERELESYVCANEMLTMLHLKARLSLRRQPAA